MKQVRVIVEDPEQVSPSQIGLGLVQVLLAKSVPLPHVLEQVE